VSRVRSLIESPSAAGFLLRCAIGLGCAAAATAVRAAWEPLLHGQIPFITYVAGVVVATWFGRTTGGVAASLGSALAGDYFFVEERFRVKVARLDHFAGITIFLVVAAVLVWLVSRWRRAEETLRHDAAQLRLRGLLIEHAHDAIFVCDRDGRIVSWNEGAERLYGWTAVEAIGRDPRVLLHARFPESLEAQSAMIGATDHWEGELTHRRKDGREVMCDSRRVVMRDGAGRPALVLQIDRDVTGRRQAEAERARLYVAEQQARLEAEAASRVKDEFLMTLSHELRTPLNSILGWSQILHDKHDDPAEIARATEIIVRNARAQTRLVEDVIDTSRIVTGQLRLQHQPVDLGTVIERALDTVRPAAKAKAIEIDAVFAGRPVVAGDADRLQQVVWNLLSNAVKFTPQHGRVEVHLARTGAGAEIRVRDSGIGIDREFLPRVFERFAQQDGSITRQHGGLGLGLAIVRHLVELHGGSIVAESAGTGQGATFIVTLPIRVGADVGLERQPASESSD
jgi:PAS domain S-box-containing protein